MVELSKEMTDVANSRNVHHPTSVVALINEFNQKWKVVARLTGLPNELFINALETLKPDMMLLINKHKGIIGNVNFY